MKKLLLFVTVLACIGAGWTWTDGANAAYINGVIKWTSGTGCNSCVVHGHNNNTGANVTTYTSGGVWVINNTQPFHRWTIWADVQVCPKYYWTDTKSLWTDSGGNAYFGTQYLNHNSPAC